MIQALALAAVGSLPGAQPEVRFEAPSFHVKGEPYVVEVTYAAGDEATTLAVWQLGPAAFEIDGRPVADRSREETLPLDATSSITVRFDLGAHLPEAATFTLGVTGAEGEPLSVQAFRRAAADLDFMTLPAERLAEYHVLFETNQGPMLFELFPRLAPNHVRNFLDLASTGFYAGTLFHRVSPNFMIQGGCPNTKTNNRSSWGRGRGPRMLEGEFSDEPHVRGILSMARGTSRNSASSQFFVMTTKNAALDDPNNPYSVFGRLMSGYATLDAIANAPGKLNPRDQTVQPSEPQRIEAAVVLVPGS